MDIIIPMLAYLNFYLVLFTAAEKEYAVL